MTTDPAISTTRDEGWVTVRWKHDIDMANATRVEMQTLESVSNTDHGLTIDLSDVEYIDSAGIRVLIAIRRLLLERQQRLLLVIPPGSVIRKALEVGGVTGLVPTFPSEESAAAAR